MEILKLRRFLGEINSKSAFLCSEIAHKYSPGDRQEALKYYSRSHVICRKILKENSEKKNNFSETFENVKYWIRKSQKKFEGRMKIYDTEVV